MGAGARARSPIRDSASQLRANSARHDRRSKAKAAPLAKVGRFEKSEKLSDYLLCAQWLVARRSVAPPLEREQQNLRSKCKSFPVRRAQVRVGRVENGRQFAACTLERAIESHSFKTCVARELLQRNTRFAIDLLARGSLRKKKNSAQKSLI